MELANLLHMYSLKITDEHKRKEYMNYTRRWQTHGTIVNILKDAQVYHTISATEFDADPYIFNCKNVTIDMNTLECREHKSSDKLTKISNVIYDLTLIMTVETNSSQKSCPGIKKRLIFCRNCSATDLLEIPVMSGV